MVDELRGKAKVSPKESVRNVSRSGEKGRTVRFSEWGKVESTLLEQRKTYGLSPLFIKFFRFPTQISILISQICLLAIRNIHPVCSQRSTPTRLLILSADPEIQEGFLPTAS